MVNAIPVLLEWAIWPADGSPHVTYHKHMTLAAAPREGDYIVHDQGWTAESAWSVMICEDYVFARFKPERPASLAKSELYGKLEEAGWERL
jgi:hypothetical protein